MKRQAVSKLAAGLDIFEPVVASGKIKGDRPLFRSGRGGQRLRHRDIRTSKDSFTGENGLRQELANRGYQASECTLGPRLCGSGGCCPRFGAA